mgnify:CR=1 FL=1
MSNERTFIRGGSTFERITLRDTFICALIYWASQIVLRLMLLSYMVVWAVVTGQAAGWLILGMLALYSQDLTVTRIVPPTYTLRWATERLQAHRQAVRLALIAGCALCIAQLVGVWPRLAWEFGDGRVWWMTANRSGSLAPLLTWLRFLFIGASLWVVWSPSMLLNWVFEIEQTHPKARETTFAQADPASVTGPDGKPYAAQARRGTRLLDAEEAEDYAADYQAIGAIHEAGS